MKSETTTRQSLSRSLRSHAAPALILLSGALLGSSLWGCSRPDGDDYMDRRLEELFRDIQEVAFIEAPESCDCTQERYDQGWTVVQRTAGRVPHVQVRRINVDTHPEKGEKYISQRDYDLVPAIYFLDRDDKVVALLQGHVNLDQVAAALAR